MVLLEKARVLIANIKSEVRKLEHIHELMEKEITTDIDYEGLYEAEFRAAMSISNSYNRLKDITNELIKNEDTMFIGRRLQMQGDALVGDMYEIDVE
jgi:hypothetical protein